MKLKPISTQYQTITSLSNGATGKAFRHWTRRCVASARLTGMNPHTVEVEVL